MLCVYLYLRLVVDLRQELGSTFKQAALGERPLSCVDKRFLSLSCLPSSSDCPSRSMVVCRNVKAWAVVGVAGVAGVNGVAGLDGIVVDHG